MQHTCHRVSGNPHLLAQGPQGIIQFAMVQVYIVRYNERGLKQQISIKLEKI